MDDRADAILARLLDALPLPAVVLAGGKAVRANAAARALLGERVGEALAHLEMPAAATAAAPVPVVLQRAGDSPMSLEASIGAPLDADGTRVVLLRDVAQEMAARDRLERAIEFERLLTRASAQLMRNGEDGLDAEIEAVLGSVGAFCGVDRAYVFLIDDEAGIQSNTHEWAAPGIAREAANLQGLPLDGFPWLLAPLRSNGVFRHASLDTLPPEARNEREEFLRQGIQSILIVPLWSAGRLMGYVGFDAVRSRVDWDDAFVVGLRLLAQTVSGALDTRAMATRLRHQAMHDALTGLPNRLYLRDRFAAADAMRAGLAVAVVDIDDFKAVNDRYGHAGGDALLRELGRRLAAAVGAGGVAARLGGDEFVVIDPTLRLQPEELAARLLAIASAPYALAAGVHEASVSVGVVRGDGQSSLDALLDRADAAMYRAKSAGKSRWEACPRTGAVTG